MTLDQKGFSIITALFILLVLAVLGGFMVTMSGVQSRTALWSFQGAQAYHAARSGIEWGSFQALNGSCIAATNLDLGDFSVIVNCQEEDSITEGSQSYSVYQLTSLAQRGIYGSGDYVSRQLQARVTGAVP